MSPLEAILIPLLGVVTVSWLALGAYLLLDRLVYDLGDRSVNAARDLLDPAVVDAADATPAGLEPILDGLSQRTIERVAADASAPERLAEVFAARAVSGDGRRRLRDRASAHGTELGRWRRFAALRILARARDEQALPLLDRALRESDEVLAGAAVAMLGTLPGERAAALLVEALRQNLYAPSRVATALDGFPLPIGDLVRPLLSDRRKVVRFWGASLAARYGHATGVAAELATLSADGDPNVRAAVAESLAHCADSKGRNEALSRLIDDPVWYVCAHAVRSAGVLDLVGEAERIARLLSDTQWWVRTAAKQALQSFGLTASSIAVSHLRDHDRFARNGAAEVLQNIGFVDSLVTEVAAPDARAGSLALLAEILEAGGPGLRSAALGGLEPDARAVLERELDRATRVVVAA
jgi:HEAT repeat protein